MAPLKRVWFARHFDTTWRTHTLENTYKNIHARSAFKLLILDPLSETQLSDLTPFRLTSVSVGFIAHVSVKCWYQNDRILVPSDHALYHVRRLPSVTSLSLFARDLRPLTTVKTRLIPLYSQADVVVLHTQPCLHARTSPLVNSKPAIRWIWDVSGCESRADVVVLSLCLYL